VLTRDGEDFTTGGARYFDAAGDNKEKRIFVRIRLEGLDLPVLAAIDTGAPWSVLSSEMSNELGLFDKEGEETSVITYQGRVAGKLVRTRVTLLAEEALGDSLDVSMTLLASQDWNGYPILGYGGLIEHIRIGLDGPGNLFYFGGA